MSLWKITDTRFADLRESFQTRYDLCTTDTCRDELTVLDDFDGHLWQAGQVLTRGTDGALVLYQGWHPIAVGTASGSSRFWWEFPEGELARQLAKHLGVRALLPCFTCHLRSESLAVLDGEGKTVARLRRYVVHEGHPSTAEFLEVIPLRGYRKDFRCLRQLAAAGGAVRARGLAFRDLFLAAGLQVETQDPKQGFNLDPAEGAEEAVMRMAAELLERCRRQEEGLCRDLDSEFLHQYRVNMRKARSLISLFRHCLARHRFLQLKAALKELAAATNTLRDLDVFLLGREAFASLLPEPFTPGLKPLFARLHRRRRRLQRQVATRLESADYRNRIGDLQKTLRAPAERATASAQRPIRSLVAEMALRQYARICRQGAAIDAASPDEAVHRLRIEAKKLRYLLELFAELFAQKPLKKLVRRLKNLQDNLGRFNDHSVQQAFLHQCEHSGRAGPEERAAIHGLVAVLYQKQHAEREKVEASIAAFVADSVRHRFHTLFAVDSQERYDQ